jgi:hypothetical protein
MSVATFLANAYTERRYSPAEEAFDLQQSIDAATRTKKWTDGVMLLIALFSVALYAYEELYDVSSPALNALGMILDGIFFVDYCLRTYYAGSSVSMAWSSSSARANYNLRWYGVVDFIATMPPILFHVFHFGGIVEEYSRIARLLRLLRATRALRALRAIRFMRETEFAQKHLREHTKKISAELKLALITLVAGIVLGGVLLHLTDESNPEFQEVGNTMFWSVLSMLGQGNGDALRSVPERLIGICIIFLGLAFFGVVTGSFTTLLMERVRMRNTGRHPFHHHNHILICGYNSTLPEILLELAINNEEREIVLVFDRGNEHEEMIADREYLCRGIGRPLHLHWVRGNPALREDLERANAKDATKIVVLADRGSIESLSSVSMGEIREEVSARTLLCFLQASHVKAAHADIVLVGSHTLIDFEERIPQSAPRGTINATGATRRAKTLIDVDAIVAEEIFKHVAGSHESRELAEAKNVVICGYNGVVGPLVSLLKHAPHIHLVSARDSAALVEDARDHVQHIQKDPRSPNAFEEVTPMFDVAVILSDDDARVRHESDRDAMTIMTYEMISQAHRIHSQRKNTGTSGHSFNPNPMYLLELLQNETIEWAIGKTNTAGDAMAFENIHSINSDELIAKNVAAALTRQ